MYPISAAFASISGSLFLDTSWWHPLTTCPRSLPPLRSALGRPSHRLRRAGHEVMRQRGATWNSPLSSSCSQFSLADPRRPCLMFFFQVFCQWFPLGWRGGRWFFLAWRGARTKQRRRKKIDGVGNLSRGGTKKTERRSTDSPLIIVESRDLDLPRMFL